MLLSVVLAMASWSWKIGRNTARNGRVAAGNPMWEHKFALILRHGLDKAKIDLEWAADGGRPLGVSLWARSERAAER
jgi:hypothetical protein